MSGAWLTLVARGVGVTGVVTSVLLVTQLAVDLLVPGAGEHCSALGVLVDNLEYWNTDVKVQASVWLFSLLTAVCSALLIYSTIVEDRRLAVPWLLAEGTDILYQVASLGLRLQVEPAESLAWGIAVTAGYLAACLLMWVVVFMARRSWGSELTSECPPPIKVTEELPESDFLCRRKSCRV